MVWIIAISNHAGAPPSFYREERVRTKDEATRRVNELTDATTFAYAYREGYDAVSGAVARSRQLGRGKSRRA